MVFLIRTAASGRLIAECGIINLDSNNGSDGYVMLILFILIPLDYHHPKIFFLSNDIILYNIKKKKISVLCGYFCIFSLKNSKMIIQFTTFCTQETQVKMKQF